MVIDLTEFYKLKKFILEEDVNETHPYFTEYCYECEHPEENNKCEYQKICLRYFPISLREDYYYLVKDLIDTIEFMLKEKLNYGRN